MRQQIEQPLCTLAIAATVLTASAAQAAAQSMVAHPAGHTPQSIVAVDVGPAVAADSHARTNPDTTITIRSLGSNLEFLPSEIAVKEGTNLRIRYVNEGTFPHNIVVVRAESDIDPLGLAAFDAAATGYVPSTKADRIVAHSTLAPPGETVEFTFVVPPAGDYPFVCLYPGHYNMMVGTLRSLR